jgi:hypothetical protein
MTRMLLLRLAHMGLVAILGGLALYLLLSGRYPYGPAATLAVLGAPMLAVAFALIRNSIELLYRRRLLAGAWGKLRDGGTRKVALTGTLVPVGDPVSLPFVSGEHVSIAYSVTDSFRIRAKYAHSAHYGWTGSTITNTYIGGLIGTDCVLRLEVGDVPILGFADPAWFPQIRVSAVEVADAIREHLHSGKVVERPGFSVGEARTLFDTIGENYTGELRFEWCRTDAAGILGGKETRVLINAIPVGAEVSVMGIYDPQAGGLRGDPAFGSLEVYPGNALEARRDMAARAARWLAMACFLIAFSTLGFLGIMALVQEDDDALRDQLTHALRVSNIDTTERLMKRGVTLDPAELDAIVREAASPMSLRALVDAGADLERVDEDGLTPLQAAVRGSRPEHVRTLLGAGANPSVRGGRYGLTAFEWATDRGDFSSAEFLRAAGGSGIGPDPATLDALPPDGGAPLVALSALYAEGQIGADGFRGFPVDFLEGVSDGRLASLRLTDGERILVHLLELNAAGDWSVVRITELEEPIYPIMLP